jgi:hypothetical protein
MTNAAIYASTSSRAPIAPTCPRDYRGNMCGVRVSGVQPVAGGADPSLVLSWFIDRYPPEDVPKIYRAWKRARCVDVLVSWPDSRVAGFSIPQFVQTCRELADAGFRPLVMFASKYYDPADVAGILANALPCLKALIRAGVIARACVGWELSLWLSPEQVQQLIDAFAAVCGPAKLQLWVHFQQGYFAFEQDKPGATTADFWNQQVGKLTGVLHQRDLSWDEAMYQARIVDCLERFAGGFGFVTDSGFGHPFDFVALEITAQTQFDGQTTEADGNRWGQLALDVPPVNGVRVMGSGNGQI